MKIIYLCMAIVFTMASCSTDSEIPVNGVAENGPQPASFRMANELPGNSDNPFDQAGKLHNAIFESYYDGSSLPTTTSAIAARVELLAASNAAFNSLKGLAYRPVPVSRVDYILGQGASCVPEILTSAGISANAKTSLTGFINAILALSVNEEDFTVIYNYITAYEDGIVANTQFTALDKQVILTTTSVSRYSCYRKKKKPKKNTDPEWDLLVTNIVSGTDSSPIGVCEAATMSLTAGIAGN